MSKIKNQLDIIVDGFFSKIIIKPKYSNEDLDIEKNVFGTDDWQPWAGKTGIYVFYDDEKIYYVGRALKNTLLGSRVSSQTNRKLYSKDTEWGKTIRKLDVKIRLYLLNNPEEDYWLAALEIYLIEFFKLEFNARRG
ncbi:MAG: hypothetical protein JXD23_05910 [Spirochaetales bacterium]|nr:hypothetical protein [Spirochaetales bacterium]